MSFLNSKLFVINAVFCALLIACLFLGWLARGKAIPSTPNASGTISTGNTNAHDHNHIHTGFISHDHQHSSIANVSHSHEYAHEEGMSIQFNSRGELIPIGHFHGMNTTSYFADVWREGDRLQIEFFQELEGTLHPVTEGIFPLNGELFVEAKLQGPISFAKKRGSESILETKLSADLIEPLPVFVVLTNAPINEAEFSFKFELPQK